MFKLLFVFFLTIHILGDFYLQTDKLANRKLKKYPYVLLHSLYYLLCSVICVLPFWSMEGFISALLLAALHFALDSARYLFTTKKRPTAMMYVIDQSIHLLFIAVVASVLAYLGYELRLLPIVNKYLSAITENPLSLLGFAGSILMIFKPANVTIKQLVGKYKPLEGNLNELSNAGASVGTLERIIILLLLSANQYAAIGLVLTAKSVARYNKLSEDKQFAEYYLLGTLLSALFAIITFNVFMY